MNDILESLKAENRRLNQRAELDWLTGLYNRMAVEEKVNALLSKKGAGVLFVLDVDHFKSINDRYGHIAGDKVLQGISRILKESVFRTDILGRVGGDEFVIFMNVDPGGDFIESRCRQIRGQFLDLPRSQFMVSKLSVTVCGSSYQAGDDYQCLFDRADQYLLKEKKNCRSIQAAAWKCGMENEKSLKVDMKQVSRELAEPAPEAGAYCQDYDSFVNIYRFLERRLGRVDTSIYSLLFTLTDEYGDFPDLIERGRLMEELHETIRLSLRAGDVFTRYSSCQFLVMVLDATDVHTDSVAERIREKFMSCPSFSDQYQLTYKRYPLKPTFPEKNTRQKNSQFNTDSA